MGMMMGMPAKQKGEYIDKCKSTPYEIIWNNTFDCALEYWFETVGFAANLTDNGDGSIHVEAIDRYGGAQATHGQPRAGNYLLSSTVENLVGAVKMNIRVNGAWSPNVSFDRGDGTYKQVFTIAENANLTDIVFSANNDVNAAFDLIHTSFAPITITETPVMTSATTPYGITTESSVMQDSPNYAGWKAMDAVNNAGELDAAEGDEAGRNCPPPLQRGEMGHS